MKIRIEDEGPCRKVLHVDVPAESLGKEYDTILKMFTGVAKVPGFRAGKAPAAVVERKFQHEIAEEAKDRLVPRYYREALKEKEITPVAIVGVGQITFAKKDGLSFQVTLDVAPDFSLPKYKKIAVKGEPVAVTDAQVQETLTRLLTSHSRFEGVTGRAVKRDDLAKIDYAGTCSGTPVRELVPDQAGLAEGKDFWVLAGEPEFLPGIAAGLTGMQAGEKKDIAIRFPADHRVAGLAGKEAVYAVTVHEIRQRVLPAMTPEFLKQFEVESEAALRDRIRKDLQSHAELALKDRQRDEVAKFLLDNTDFDVPKSVVEEETELAIRTLVRRFASQGATQKDIEDQKHEIIDNAARSSKDRVKLGYILGRIAGEEKIDASEDEVNQHIESMAKRYNTSVERLRSELEKASGMERLKSDIRNGKAMDFLLENAKVK